MVDQLLLPDRDLNTNVKRFEKPHSCKKYNADHVQYILTKQNGSNITKADFDAYINEMAAKRPGITSCGALGKGFQKKSRKDTGLAKMNNIFHFSLLRTFFFTSITYKNKSVLYYRPAAFSCKLSSHALYFSNP